MALLGVCLALCVARAAGAPLKQNPEWIKMVQALAKKKNYVQFLTRLQTASTPPSALNSSCPHSASSTLSWPLFTTPSPSCPAAPPPLPLCHFPASRPLFAVAPEG